MLITPSPFTFRCIYTPTYIYNCSTVYMYIMCVYCLWTTQIHPHPPQYYKHKIPIPPRFRIWSYNWCVTLKKYPRLWWGTIQSLMTAININNVRLLSQLLLSKQTPRAHIEYSTCVKQNCPQTTWEAWHLYLSNPGTTRETGNCKKNF